MKPSTASTTRITRANLEALGVDAENARICEKCRVVAVNSRGGRCPIKGCTRSKRKVKSSKPFPPEYVQLGENEKKFILEQIEIHIDKVKICHRCTTRIIEEVQKLTTSSDYDDAFAQFCSLNGMALPAGAAAVTAAVCKSEKSVQQADEPVAAAAAASTPACRKGSAQSEEQEEKAWTDDETARLLDLNGKLGDNWKAIAAKMRGRNEEECRLKLENFKQGPPPRDENHSPVVHSEAGNVPKEEEMDGEKRGRSTAPPPGLIPLGEPKSSASSVASRASSSAAAATSTPVLQQLHQVKEEIGVKQERVQPPQQPQHTPTPPSQTPQQQLQQLMAMLGQPQVQHLIGQMQQGLQQLQRQGAAQQQPRQQQNLQQHQQRLAAQAAAGTSAPLPQQQSAQAAQHAQDAQLRVILQGLSERPHEYPAEMASSVRSLLHANNQESLQNIHALAGNFSGGMAQMFDLLQVADTPEAQAVLGEERTRLQQQQQQQFEMQQRVQAEKKRKEEERQRKEKEEREQRENMARSERQQLQQQMDRNYMQQFTANLPGSSRQAAPNLQEAVKRLNAERESHLANAEKLNMDLTPLRTQVTEMEKRQDEIRARIEHIIVPQLHEALKERLPGHNDNEYGATAMALRAEHERISNEYDSLDQDKLKFAKKIQEVEANRQELVKRGQSALDKANQLRTQQQAQQLNHDQQFQQQQQQTAQVAQGMMQERRRLQVAAAAAGKIAINQNAAAPASQQQRLTVQAQRRSDPSGTAAVRAATSSSAGAQPDHRDLI